MNDVSEPAWQMERDGQWLRGKSAETFSQVGPWLATTDEIADVNDFEMWLDVVGVRRQIGDTRTRVFDPYVVVHCVSQFPVLEPGDLIPTSTRRESAWGSTRLSGYSLATPWNPASPASVLSGTTCCRRDHTRDLSS